MLGEHRKQHESSPVIFDESRARLWSPWRPPMRWRCRFCSRASWPPAWRWRRPSRRSVCYGSGKTTNGSQQPSHSPAGFADCALACAQGLSAAAILPPDISPALCVHDGRASSNRLPRPISFSPRASPETRARPSADRVIARGFAARHPSSARRSSCHSLCAHCVRFPPSQSPPSRLRPCLTRNPRSESGRLLQGGAESAAWLRRLARRQSARRNSGRRDRGEADAEARLADRNKARSLPKGLSVSITACR